MSVTRLAAATLVQARPEVARPLVDPRSVTPGIVHLGLGVFHRAHQALITEEAMAASGDPGWGIIGVTQRSARVVDQLRPQDCLYTVLEKSPERTSARVVGSIREVHFPAVELPQVLDALTTPRTRVITATITEKGYRVGPDRRLVIDDEVRADAAGLLAGLRGARHAKPPRTAIGLLASGLALRCAGSGAPVAVVSCDNMVANGETLARCVADFLSLVDHPMADRALTEVSFVSTVVDRMVPTSTPAVIDEVSGQLGLRDEAAALAEPFWQWVLQDRFPAGRPAWDRLGATFADDVTPYELLKLRLLNASHSLLSYLGSLAGFRTIPEAIAVPEFRDAAWSLMVDEAAPGLALPDEIDPVEYSRTVMVRYHNSALGHQTAQVAMEGSQKLPLRLPPIAEGVLDRGGEPRAAALTYAAWMVFLARRQTLDGRPLAIEDPRAEELCATAAGPESSLVDRFLKLPGIFSERLVEDAAWRRLLIEATGRFGSSSPSDWARLG